MTTPLAVRIARKGVVALPSTPMPRQILQGIESAIASSRVIAADAVGDYFYADPKEVWQFDTDYPCVAPPFQDFFIEFGRPKRIYSTELGERDPAGMPTRFGWLFQYVDAPDDVGPLDDLGGALPIEFLKGRWLVSATLIMYTSRRVFALGAVWLFAIAADGTFAHPTPKILFPMGKPQLTTHEIAALQALIHPAFLAISFMHCKNARFVERVYRHHPQRRRSKSPTVKYYTLAIDTVQHLRAESVASNADAHNALHICRGHFKDYRNGAGLFGKTRGLFWWSEHRRGSADEGIVVKDYEVRNTE